MIDDPEYRNWTKFEKEQSSLADWRYRVVSTLLVASSAVLALSFDQPLSEFGNQYIRNFRRVALIANTVHILACVAALGLLLYARKNRVDTIQMGLQQPIYSKWAILETRGRRIDKALKISVILSFVAFAVLALALAACGLIA